MPKFINFGVSWTPSLEADITTLGTTVRFQLDLDFLELKFHGDKTKIKKELSKNQKAREGYR